MKGEKYTIDNLKWYKNTKTWAAVALIYIANELHGIYSILWEMKKSK